MDDTTYIPMPGALQQLSAVSLGAIVGPTAAGKTTLIKAAMQQDPNIHLVLNHTSRQPRPDERNGVDYFFHTREEMLQMKNRREFVQVAPSVLDEIYATRADSYATDGVAVLAILAQAMPEFRALPFKTVRSIFIIPPDYATWQDRIKQHGFTVDHVRRRLQEAALSFEFALQDQATQLIVNEELAVAARDFVTLAQGRPLPPRLQADQVRGREIVQSLLVRLRASL